MIVGENLTFLSIHPFSIFLYCTRIKRIRELPWNLPVHRSPIQGTAVTKQSDAKKAAGYYAIKVWQVSLPLAFLSLNPGWTKIRWWTQVPWGSPPDGKALTQHWLFFCGDHAPIVAAHLMIVQPSREADFFLNTWLFLLNSHWIWKTELRRSALWVQIMTINAQTSW